MPTTLSEPATPPPAWLHSRVCPGGIRTLKSVLAELLTQRGAVKQPE